MFEYLIWNKILSARHYYPAISDFSRWRDTAAKVRSHALPGKLEYAAKTLNLTNLKDETGSAVMKKLSQPRKPTKDNPDTRYLPDKYPDMFEQLYSYCAQDVIVERDIHNILPELTPTERKIWLLDQKINLKGFKVDTTYVEKATELIAAEETRLLGEFTELTGLESPRQTVKTLELINGLVEKPVLNLQKETLATYKQKNPNLPETVDKILSLRQKLSVSSAAKFEALKRYAANDCRVHGAYIYHGASTGRWTAGGIQPHNLARMDRHQVLEVINNVLLDDLEWLQEIYTDVVRAISLTIRGTITATSQNHTLFVSDFSSIEAIVTAWIAGAEHSLESFRRKECAYCKAATGIYNRRITKKENPDERQVGKVAVLALGYQGGISAFAKFCEAYRLSLEPLYEIIVPTATEAERLDANISVKRYMKASKSPISEKAAYVADIIKQRWRKSNPEIAHCWNALENYAKAAIASPGSVFKTCKCMFQVKNNFLYITLPSGRSLAYLRPELSGKGTDKHISFMGINSVTKQMESQSTYGGTLLENIVQAVSRDLEAEAMLRLDDAGFDIVLHTHDEAVSDVPTGFKTLEDYEALMVQLPDWGKDIPISAESWKGFRYGK
jgi:DNA polymerase